MSTFLLIELKGCLLVSKLRLHTNPKISLSFTPVYMCIYLNAIFCTFLNSIYIDFNFFCHIKVFLCSYICLCNLNLLIVVAKKMVLMVFKFPRFARLCAAVFLSKEIKVFLFSDVVPTPFVVHKFDFFNAFCTLDNIMEFFS